MSHPAVLPPGPRGPRAVRPPGRPALAVAIALSGRSHANIGRAVGVTGGSISSIVAGTQNPSRRVAARIAALLDVRDVDELFRLAAVEVSA